MALVVAAAFILSACAGQSEPSGPPVLEPSDRAEPAEGIRFSPPALTLTSDAGEQVELHAFSYCWTAPDVSLCADGDPWYFGAETLAGDTTFSMAWPLDGWSWTVEARTQDADCSAVLPRLTNQQAGTPIVAPAGGELVFVAGRGPEGDATFAFSPSFGAATSAVGMTATVSLAPPEVSPVDAKGLAVQVSNVDTQPDHFSASAVIEGSDGRVAEFELVPAASGDCWSGSLHAAIDPDAPGVGLTGFGLPLAISVDMVIGDVVLRSDPVTWPDDFTTNTAQSPNLALSQLGR